MSETGPKSEGPANWFLALNDEGKKFELNRHYKTFANLIRYKLELTKIRLNKGKLPPNNVTGDIQKEMDFIDHMLTIITERSYRIGASGQTENSLNLMRQQIAQIRGLKT